MLNKDYIALCTSCLYYYDPSLAFVILSAEPINPLNTLFKVVRSIVVILNYSKEAQTILKVASYEYSRFVRVLKLLLIEALAIVRQDKVQYLASSLSKSLNQIYFSYSKTIEALTRSQYQGICTSQFLLFSGEDRNSSSAAGSYAISTQFTQALFVLLSSRFVGRALVNNPLPLIILRACSSSSDTTYREFASSGSLTLYLAVVLDTR